MIRTFIACACFLPIAALASASAQGTDSVRVLQLPPDAAPATSLNWNTTLSINYNGRLDAERKIWVRVFRGSKHDLIATTPQLTPRNKCAIYAQLVVLSVDHGMDGQLRVGDLQDFFKMVRQQRQIFTLVFEEGGDRSQSEPLLLEKKARNISNYFSSGVEVTLTSDPGLDALWHSEAAAELAASQPPPKTWLGKALATVGIGSTVQAATYQPPVTGAAVGAPMQEQPKLDAHCLTVQPVPFRAQLENPPASNPTQEALAPILQFQSTACGE
jgi:hypothetical protein